MRLRLPVIAGLAFLLGGLIALLAIPAARERLLGVVPQPLSVGQALVGGPFSLVDQHGKRVTERDFLGKYMLVMFGFTYCPDICPSGLQVITAALDQAGPNAERIVPVFISVDHERDTPAQLAQYAPSFHARLVALSGTAENVAAAARAYRVYYKKVADPKSSAGFTYDHSALIYLMGPDGKYVTHFSHAAGPDTIAARLRQLP
ncbi:MAG: SCO family protein [Hyphomicrobiaceae bacterium]|nr:SCO family protein [Hyphomicrobiaceae bacterium]